MQISTERKKSSCTFICYERLEQNTHVYVGRIVS